MNVSRLDIISFLHVFYQSMVYADAYLFNMKVYPDEQ